MAGRLNGRSPARSNSRRPLTSVNWPWITDWLARWMLPPYFAVFSFAMVVYFLRRDLIGIDSRIYARAAATWLAGGDPWFVPVHGYLFAAPPPTLLPFVPFGLLGESVTATFWVLGSLVAGILIIRHLQLPIWWILFPPLVNGILAGNADVLLVALLLRGGSAGAALAAFLKIYALVPVIGERRWRALLLTVTALAVTVPFLPWAAYLDKSEEIVGTLARQAIGISGYGTPWLMIATAIALVRLGSRLGGWLAVPALWPHTQLHYSTLALPALARTQATPMAAFVAALLFAPEIRWLPAVAVLVLTIGTIVRGLRRTA